MVFLELRRDSRVTTGNSGASCVGPGKSNLPFELRRKAGDCSRVTAGPCWARLKPGEGTSEDEMVGWHHLLNGHEFEQALGVDDGQGSLACYSP